MSLPDEQRSRLVGTLKERLENLMRGVRKRLDLIIPDSAKKEIGI